MAKSLHNFLVYHIHDRQLKLFADTYLSGRLIDIGCGTKPYKELLSNLVQEHIGLDREDPFNPNAVVDIFGTAYEIPVEDESFDCSISTGALEHLEEPETALRECHRILKDGGVAIYSVPFIWQVHAAPWDYYRFSKHGLKYLFEKCGFEILELKALSGFWVTFGQLFIYYIYRFRSSKKPWRYIPVIPLLAAIIQPIAYLLDKLDKAEDWTWMYMIAVRKKST